MRTVHFLRPLDPDNVARIEFSREHGRVLEFVVQLECNIEGAWRPIMRYDTAHGFAHCDRLHPYKPTVKTELPIQNYKQALTFAIQDFISNWKSYRRRYELWLKTK